jgi:integrase
MDEIESSMASSLADARPRQTPLTDRSIKALSPKAAPIDIRDGGQPGLVLTVLPSGRKQFTVRYRFQGKQRRLLLGEYPSTSLAEARKRARRAQTAVDDGRDPSGERQAAKAKRTDTVSALVDDYLEKHARKFKRSADEDERILSVEVLPRWGNRSVRELSRRDVRALIERKAERAPIAANRLLAVIRKMLNFGVDHDWIEANPAARVAKPAPEQSRDRVLSADEVRRVWRILSNLPTTGDKPAPGRKRARGTKDDPLCPISAQLAALLKVRLLTAQRGGEVAHMRWADVDLQSAWWTIPGSDTKNGEPHRVPLAGDAIEIIQAQEPDEKKRGVYVFTGDGEATVVHRAKKAPAVLARALGIDFHGHDLRRTASTYMAEAGVPREHISFVLNHVDGGSRATKIYDRYSRDNEKRVALEIWARRLNTILENQPPSAVVPFTKHA